jgi:hypothetical protein
MNRQVSGMMEAHGWSRTISSSAMQLKEVACPGRLAQSMIGNGIAARDNASGLRRVLAA